MDPNEGSDLMFIAHLAIDAEVSAGWTVHLYLQGFEFFAHSETRSTQYEHPMDAFYMKMYKDSKVEDRAAVRYYAHECSLIESSLLANFGKLHCNLL
jgi:hypothetical protein